MKKFNHGMIVRVLALGITLIILMATLNIVALTEDIQPNRILGQNGMILMLVGTLGLYIYIFHRQTIKQVNKWLLFLTLCLVTLVPSFILGHTDLIWLIPFSTSALIIAIMLDESLGIVTHIMLILIIAIEGSLTADFLMFYSISGIISIFLIGKAKERQRIFYGSIYVIVLNIVLLTLIQFNHGIGWVLPTGRQLLYVGVNAVFSIVLATGSLPLWETLFNITTPYKLLELTNASQVLLKRLMMEAPGTYHHSQMVANLAETAALDIGANAILARTGALYHDIGKLKNPNYFIENQNGFNPHDELAPDSSAKIIISHVDDGVKLAQEHKLPVQIVDIIRQHQGNAILGYFFDKAKHTESSYDIDAKDFTYRGPKPLTNEAAIVMLADCVEAYVRSNPERNATLEGVQTMIDEMILMRFKEGQLNKSDLKISDLPLVAESFLKVYNGMFHERIKYVKE